VDFQDSLQIISRSMLALWQDFLARLPLIAVALLVLLVLPNSTLFKDPVSVLTQRPIRRTTVICGIAYGEDVDQAREVIRKAVQACKTVSREREVEIFAREFGESSINFEVTWWSAPTPLDVRRSKDEVVAAVKRALDEAGIEIPFPYRTLTFKHPLELRSQPAAKDRGA
jgi:small conductance mechanosensitive channel